MWYAICPEPKPVYNQTVLARVIGNINRYNMFQPGHKVGVAVSGGADSVCLLHVLRELAPRWALQLEVLHLDHGLRGEESRADAEFVRNLAHEWGYRVRMGTEDVRRRARETGDNLEQAAREARRQFLLGFLERGELDRVALGHTRSDQAETVLYRFMRGAGTAGLAGIRPATSEGLVRPLILIGREEVRLYLRERGIAWREDSSNQDLGFARNRIRHELMPALAAQWNPALEETLAHTADWALAEEEWRGPEIARLAADIVTAQGHARLLDAGKLAALPLAAARRVVRLAVEKVKGDLRGIDFEHIESILAMARGGEGHARLQIPGLDVLRSFEWLRIAPFGDYTLEGRNFRFPLTVPGHGRIPGSGSTVHVELIEKSSFSVNIEKGYNDMVGCLDWERISGLLELRNWRPGDQYQPVGHTAPEKIKSLFQHARVPLWERRNWPVVTAGEEIVWARRFGPAAACAATAASRAVLTICEVKSGPEG